MIEQLTSFAWDRHPALWIGLFMLLSIGFCLGWGIALVPWAILFFWPWIQKKRGLHCLLACMLGVCCFYYAQVSFPSKIEEKKNGKGVFQIQDIRQEESPFGRRLVYIGQLLSFQDSSGNLFHNLPCRIYLKRSQERPIADCDYFVQGNLVPRQWPKYIFKPSAPWLRIENAFSFSELRYRAKNSARNYLARVFQNSRAYSLFSALIIGEIDDRQMAKNFRNLGLSHILAISGFHFALIGAISTTLLCWFLPRKISAFIVFAFLTGYAFFLGTSPSILRAWSAISLVLWGRILGYRTTGLNALGAGLIIELLFDPLLATQASFALSFLATAAILLLYPLCEYFLQSLFIKRRLSSIETLSFLEKHLYLASSLMRKALALNLSVHLVGIPACLLLFHAFPWLSLFYNMFYPFLIAISMIFFIVALPLDMLISPLGSFLHTLNRNFTESILDMISHPPLLPQLQIHIGNFPGWAFSLWLLFLIFLAFFLEKKRSEATL
jgi:competence protein ComEC